MSRLSRESAILRSLTEPDVQMPVESSALREAIGLRWNLRPGAERMDPEKLGKRIDDCSVEWIASQLLYLEDGEISIEEFKWGMGKIEEGMEEDPDLRARAAALQRCAGLPLASVTYLNLAKRHVLFDGERPPSHEEGRQFAVAQLDEVSEADGWEMDWDGPIFISLMTATWLDSGDPRKLENLIHESESNPIVWDTLQRICHAFADSGVDPPPQLLEWSFRATHGDLERPDAERTPRQRPRKFGYMLRDNESRYTVDLLTQVGMRTPAGREAVAVALNLEESRIQQICREPYWTILDLIKHAMKRLNASSPDPRMRAWR